VVVDRGGLFCGDRRYRMGACRWEARPTRRRTIGGEPKGPPPLHGGLDQSVGFGGPTPPRLHDLLPRAIARGAAPDQLLVGKPGQSAHMTPIGAGGVTAVVMSQLPGYCRCDARLQSSSADVNPSLQAPWTGLKHQTGLMSIPAHP